MCKPPQRGSRPTTELNAPGHQLPGCMRWRVGPPAPWLHAMAGGATSSLAAYDGGCFLAACDGGWGQTKADAGLVLLFSHVYYYRIAIVPCILVLVFYLMSLFFSGVSMAHVGLMLSCNCCGWTTEVHLVSWILGQHGFENKYQNSEIGVPV